MRYATVAIRARIEVRAYFLTLDTGADHLAAWLAAEVVEMALADKRSAAARKGAATRAAAKLIGCGPAARHAVASSLTH